MAGSPNRGQGPSWTVASAEEEEQNIKAADTEIPSSFHFRNVRSTGRLLPDTT
jgi:hypothetical protein